MNPKALLVFFVFAMALQATQGHASIWETKKDEFAHCNALSDEIKKWWPGAQYELNNVVTDSNLNRAIAIFEQIQYPSDSDLKELQASVTTSFDQVYPKYIHLVMGDCPSVRNMLGKALIHTAAGNSAKRVEIESELKKMLGSLKYPTFLGASLDRALIKEGVERGLWKMDDESKKVFEDQRIQLLQSIRSWDRQYQPIFAKLSDKSIFGQSNSDLQKAKEGFLFEQENSLKYFAQIRNLVSKLR